MVKKTFKKHLNSIFMILEPFCIREVDGKAYVFIHKLQQRTFRPKANNNEKNPKQYVY